MTTSLVIATALDGRAVAYDRAEGTERWSVMLGPVATQPVASDDGLVVPRPQGLALVDLATGDVIAERSLGSGVVRSMTVVSHGIYLSLADGTLLALR